MFEVVEKSEKGSRYADVYKVYSTRVDEQGQTKFLIFKYSEWHWVSADEYVPYSG